VANTGLVFAFVWMLSRRRFWTAVATSLFFGIHPMHVESVAWIAERKDVLYTLFYLLGLLAYLRYLERRRWVWLAACLAAFALSLASKPAAVVFPLTLLALDSFFQRRDRLRLALEKLPFLALSIAAGLLTLEAQRAAGAVVSRGTWTFFEKVLFAAYGSLMYVLKLFVPVHLSAVYPYPARSGDIGAAFYAALAVMLVAFPALLFACRRLRPVLFGWAFFFVNIVLVLQFVTVGQALMADRYTYLPYVGLLVGLTWWLDERPQPGTAGVPARLALGVVLVAMLPLFLYQTWTRCGVWKNAETLWTDTIHKYPGRVSVAHNNLGNVFVAEGRLEDAIPQFREAIWLDGENSEACNNLGNVLAARGRRDEAIAAYREAIRLLGGAMSRTPEALRLKQRCAEVHYNLGIALAARGRLEEAVSHLREAVRLNDGFAMAHDNLGAALAQTGRTDEAIQQLRRALQLDPNCAPAQRNLMQVLRDSGRADEAITPRSPVGQRATR
jgi:Flp pilus assembly protein TadD